MAAPQGTVTQKLASVFKLDDGTGAVDVVAGLQQDAPQTGLDLASVKVGDYVLVVGKVVPSIQGTGKLSLKVHKVGADQGVVWTRQSGWSRT